MVTMEEEPTSTKSPTIIPIRKAPASDESNHLRNRASTNRFSNTNEAPSPTAARRRSSGFSEYSLAEARRTFQSSTDDLLLPRPSATGEEPNHSSPWHSAPLVFALLPAIGGLLFKNGSSVVTDVMLLGLAAILLNWSVRLPWDWYHSAQSIRKKEEYNGDVMVEEESEDEALSFSQGTLDEVPEEEESAKPTPKPIRRLPAHETATNELYAHEVLALLSCFLFPLLGAYLLHTIRSQLSRPSEGLVSDYNLTIFLLASELRPMAHLVRLIRSRTLHLQRVVNANPYDTVNGKDTGVKELARRLDELEARSSTAVTSSGSLAEPVMNGKQSSVLTTEVRRTLQPELDALNRAVRRYEKRATLQAFQTESRLLDLEGRLNDAISLSAAVANHSNRPRGFTAILVEGFAIAIVLPLQAFAALSSLPFKTMITLINFGKTSVVGRQPPEKARKSVNGKYPTHGRAGERLQSRASKR